MSNFLTQWARATGTAPASTR